MLWLTVRDWSSRKTHKSPFWKAISGNSEVLTRTLKSSRPDQPFSPSDGGSGIVAEYLPVR
jgi:hypothetical protein